MSNEQDWYGGGWFQTFTGKKFFPCRPRVEDICIEDIAHALSNICRYNGHSRQFYSVAQHCVIVSDAMPNWKLEGLMHDAAEAYIGDMTRPLKHSTGLEQYRNIEHSIEVHINVAFDLETDPYVHSLVKEYDNRALFTEKKFVLTNSGLLWSEPVEPLDIVITPWTPEQSELEFLERFHYLQRLRVSA